MEGVEDIWKPPGEGIGGMGDLPEVSRCLEQRWTVVSAGHPRRRPRLRDGQAGRPQAGQRRRSTACGPSCSRRSGPGRTGVLHLLAHHRLTGPSGEPVPGTYAAEDELFGIGGALSRRSVELGSAGELLLDAVKEVDWMRLSTDPPVTLLPPGRRRARSSAGQHASSAEEGHLHPQIAGRPTGILSGHHTTLCFLADIPEYQALVARGLPAPEFAAALADPEVRRRITEWRPSSPAQAEAMEKAYGRSFVLGEPPDYEPGPEKSLAGLAASSGRTPTVKKRLRRHSRTRGRACSPILNYATGDLDTCARCCCTRCLGLSTAVPHETICDASMPTFMLTRGPRPPPVRPCRCPTSSRSRPTTRRASLRATGPGARWKPARAGRPRPDRLRRPLAGRPLPMQADLPAGGRRTCRRPTRYVATIKKSW